MPQDPHTTVKFPKVVPVDGVAPSAAGPTPPEGPAPAAIASERPRSEATAAQIGAAAAWYEDPPTIRGTSVVLTSNAGALADRALLTVLLGVNAGQVFTLDRDETVIGRGREATISLDDPGMSRRHARVVRESDGRQVLEDLGSTNGVFVNARPVARVELADGDRIQLGPAVLLRFSRIAEDEAALARQLYEGSTRDALTRMYNRKYASERLVAEVAYAQRHGTRVAVILFDIDHFKRVNDTFGHQAGDAVLRVLAAQAQRSIRAEDVLARYGGEEFLVIVRGIEHRNVLVLAERIRKAVERLSIPWESQTLRTTISGGVSSLSECDGHATADRLVSLADERLYRAKEGGRNRVC